MAVTVRPMILDDVPAAVACTAEAFRAIDEAEGAPPMPPETAAIRQRHLCTTDPGGAWVAEDDGAIIGVALALRRSRPDGRALWGLSLLVVDPRVQSAGVGRQLLDATLGYAQPDDARIIISSIDPRAIRRYALAGFALHPTFRVTGQVRVDALPPAPQVRPGDSADVAHADAVDLDVRGYPHGPDHLALLEVGLNLLVHPDGYAYAKAGRVAMVAARDEAAAIQLLTAGLRRAADEPQVEVLWLRSGTDWAVQICLAAGLTLQPYGPVCLRDLTLPSTYLPNGGYL